jgi:hypothetical protein
MIIELTSCISKGPFSLSQLLLTIVKDLNPINLNLKAYLKLARSLIKHSSLIHPKIENIPAFPLAPNLITLPSPFSSITSTGTVLWNPAFEFSEDMFVGSCWSLTKICASPAAGVTAISVVLKK